MSKSLPSSESEISSSSLTDRSFISLMTSHHRQEGGVVYQIKSIDGAEWWWMDGWLMDLLGVGRCAVWQRAREAAGSAARMGFSPCYGTFVYV